MKKTFTPKDIRHFTYGFLGLFSLVLGWSWYRHGAPTNFAWTLWIIALLMTVVALLRSELLQPVVKQWMRLAFALGWVNTRIILFLVFFLLLTPIGLLMRLIGKDVLALKWRTKGEASYWIKQTSDDRMKRSDHFDHAF